jgi:hypothetical protein
MGYKDNSNEDGRQKNTQKMTIKTTQQYNLERSSRNSQMKIAVFIYIIYSSQS